MDIQSSAPLSLLDQLAPNTAGQAAGKDDEFAKMMNRLMSDAMERKREEQRAAQAERPRAPARPAAKPQPPRAEPASAPRAAEAHAANDARARDRTEAKDPAVRDAAREDDTAVRKTEAKGTTDKADAADKTTRTAKESQPARTDKTTDKAAADGADANKDPAAGTGEEAAPQTAETTEAADGTEATADAAAGDGGELVVIEAEVTITETTVQVITEDSELTLTALSGLAQVQVDGFDGEAAAEAADALTVGAATAAGQGSAAPATPEEMLKAALDAAAGPAAKAGEASGEAAKAAGAQAAAADGAASGEALPTDDSFALPDDMADLIAAIDERKGADKAANTGNGDAGAQSEGQPQNQAQPNAQAATQTAQAAVAKPDAAEALKPAVPTAEATAAAVDAIGATGGTARSEHTAANLNHAALAGLEVARGPAGADAMQPLATLRPSRGAHMPMGVPDQLAVHVQKNVKEGNDQFTINLRPDELGRIEIKLDFQQEGRVQVVIAVDKPQTLELLQRDARSLEKALQDAGVKADSGSLSFSLRGDGNPFAGEGGNGSGSGRRGRGVAGDEEDPADAAAAYALTLAPGRVDFRV